jgi:peptide/nickel transport system permease protein
MDITGRVDNTVASIEDEPILELTPALTQKRRSQGRIIFDRFIRNKAAFVGLAALILLFLFCFLGPLVTGHNRPDVLHPTDAAQAPSWQYPFGTDDVGRDQFARAMAGGQVSLLVGLISMLVALTFGIGIGSFAGYFGGIIDNILMRLTDIMLSVPYLLLLFVLSASFSDGSPRTIELGHYVASGSRRVYRAQRA